MSDETRIGVFVCGGRHFADAEFLATILDAVGSRPGIARIVEIGDRAGLMAADWAAARSVQVTSIQGQRMSSVGRSRLAERIVAAGSPELAIGFAGGVTTAALLDELALLGVRIRSITPAGAEPAEHYGQGDVSAPPARGDVLDRH